jgi:hypothetical protein
MKSKAINPNNNFFDLKKKEKANSKIDTFIATQSEIKSKAKKPQNKSTEIKKIPNQIDFKKNENDKSKNSKVQHNKSIPKLNQIKIAQKEKAFINVEKNKIATLEKKANEKLNETIKISFLTSDNFNYHKMEAALEAYTTFEELLKSNKRENISIHKLLILRCKVAHCLLLINCSLEANIHILATYLLLLGNKFIFQIDQKLNLYEIINKIQTILEHPSINNNNLINNLKKIEFQNKNESFVKSVKNEILNEILRISVELFNNKETKNESSHFIPLYKNKYSQLSFYENFVFHIIGLFILTLSICIGSFTKFYFLKEVFLSVLTIILAVIGAVFFVKGLRLSKHRVTCNILNGIIEESFRNFDLNSPNDFLNVLKKKMCLITH